MSGAERIDPQWVRDRFSDALEEALPPEERERFERALRQDPALAEEYARFREALGALRSLREAPMPPPPDLVAGVRRRLEERGPARYRRRRPPWGLGPWMPTVALLAVLALVAVAFAIWQAVATN